MGICSFQLVRNICVNPEVRYLSSTVVLSVLVIPSSFIRLTVVPRSVVDQSSVVIPSFAIDLFSSASEGYIASGSTSSRVE
ncbi:hypothetical protein IEQ34_012763 [Dendrobium chrysotoxum]|uniref:Uncharacterized protein n=1 Tax=Dendrobium chrysotoxum TaxID=161865 RepID=A0AAV7GP23_DENCH|nr:hypothetical protein IEQ34_012763 [Dendrobium chrysotoxum]